MNKFQLLLFDRIWRASRRVDGVSLGMIICLLLSTGRVLGQPDTSWTLQKRVEEYESNYRAAVRLAQQNGWRQTYLLGGERLARLQYIDEKGQPVYYTTHNNPLSAGSRTEALYTGGALRLNLSGASAILRNKMALWDGGLVRNTHRELKNKVAQGTDNTLTLSDHATHVAGILVASGVLPEVRGMAFGASIQAWDFTNDLAEITKQAPNLLLSNHAYGPVTGWVLNQNRPGTSNDDKWEWWGTPAISPTEDYRYGFYDRVTSDLDRIAYTNPYYLMVRSADNKRTETGPPAGKAYFLQNTNTTSTAPRSKNDGYDILPPEATAKNVLTVGAATVFADSFSLAPYSGWGPTDDGRIKPDLLGVGTGVYSTVASSDAAYATFSGTSMASANVTGTLLLLQELYQQRQNRFMLAASLKGLVIHTATKPKGMTRPSYTYGWGLLNAERAAQVLLNTDGSHLLEESLLIPGQSVVRQIVADGKGPLVVTISWNDPEASPTSVLSRNVNDRSPKLINDLDLLVREGFVSWLPWTLNPDAPNAPAVPGNNSRDNVEQIYIANPVVGRTYTLTINHKATLQGGQQPFTLLVSGIQPPRCEVARTLTPDGDTTLCSASSIRLQVDAGTNLTYEWLYNGATLQKGSERAITVSQPGNYAVRVSGPGCSMMSRTVAVQAATLFATTIPSGQVTACSADGITLRANTQPGYTYQWFRNDLPIEGAIQPTFQATQSGRYTVRVSYKDCLAQSPVAQVTVHPIRNILNQGNSVSICNGSPAQLSLPVQLSGQVVSWYADGVLVGRGESSSFSTLREGTYHAEIALGVCQVKTPPVVVRALTLRGSIEPPASFVVGTSNIVTLQATLIGSEYTYQWFRNDLPLNLAQSPLLTVREAGVYRVMIGKENCFFKTPPISLYAAATRPGQSSSVGQLLDTSRLLTLYPNPAEQVVVVAIRDSLLEVVPADASFTASLYSITGQLIETKTLVSEYDYMATRFVVGHLAPGTYVVRAQVGPIPYSDTFIKR